MKLQYYYTDWSFVFPDPAGLIAKWEQRSLSLAVTGDVRFVRLWDVETELKKQDVPTGTDCWATCIDVDGSGTLVVASITHKQIHQIRFVFLGRIMALGCLDGSVRLFDRRLPPEGARIMTWREHTSWVLGTFLRQSSTKLFTGSLSGDIKIFDLRKNSSINTIQVAQGITAFTIHEIADVFAW